LFELLTNPPTNADTYRFDSVAVKEPKFEIDGVFLPPENEGVGVIYFCEVQFQKDEKLYERVFAESALYFYRNRDRFYDWQAVIIYPSRSIEQNDIYPHRSLLNGGQVHRVYLDELGDIRTLPLWLALMVLTTLEEEQAPEEARKLVALLINILGC
jgi:predicted transposase/invertase (TIGR01784 family)